MTVLHYAKEDLCRVLYTFWFGVVLFKALRYFLCFIFYIFFYIFVFFQQQVSMIFKEQTEYWN